MKRLWLAFAVLALALAAGPRARAHPAALTSAQAAVEADGSFRLTMRFDALAFALNDTSARIGNAPMEALLSGPREMLAARLAEARERFLHGFGADTDRGPGAVDACAFPDADAVLAFAAGTKPVLPVLLPVRVEGRLPPGARTVAFRFPAVLAEVILTVERPGEEASAEPVAPGAASAPLALRPPGSQPAAGSPAQPPAPAPAPVPPRSWAATGRYVGLGFRHIVPEGTDHILFVLGLFLLNARLRPLLAQITAFTVAHSVTLALSLYGVVRLPAAVVEPLIALSIAFVAVENLLSAEVRATRLLVVFGFGLVHGLGFATALTGLDLPRRDFLTALAGFNAGIEGGQLAVVAVAAATIGLLRRWPRYRQAVVWPLSAAIAATAIFWTVQRAFFTVPS